MECVQTNQYLIWYIMPVFKSKYPASKLVRNIGVETTVAQGLTWRTFSMSKSKFPSVETGTQYQSAQCLNWRTISKCWCRNQSTQCLNWRTTAFSKMHAWLVPSKIPKYPMSKLAYNCMSKCRDWYRPRYLTETGTVQDTKTPPHCLQRVIQTVASKPQWVTDV